MEIKRKMVLHERRRNKAPAASEGRIEKREVRSKKKTVSEKTRENCLLRKSGAK